MMVTQNPINYSPVSSAAMHAPIKQFFKVSTIKKSRVDVKKQRKEDQRLAMIIKASRMIKLPVTKKTTPSNSKESSRRRNKTPAIKMKSCASRKSQLN